MKLFRYYYLCKDVFASITDLEYSSAMDLYERVKEQNLAPRTNNLSYIEARLLTEKRIKEEFLKKGGVAERDHPYYLTLERCDNWFFDAKNCFGALAIDLDEFDLSTLSFTYGDSIPTFMDTFDDGRPYRKNVYTYEEIKSVIKKHGFPQKWNTYGEKGPENYIEVQVWSDSVINKFRPVSENFIENIVGATIKASSKIDDKVACQKGLKYYLDFVKKSPYYAWFIKKLKSINKDVFFDSPVHGASHSLKSAFLSFVLATIKGYDEIKAKASVFTGLYHDIGRSDDGYNLTHGQIGSEIVEKYIDFPFDKKEIEKIKEAICHHTDNKKINNEYLINLRDVDSLDYMRLGFSRYDPSHLKTKEAKELIRCTMELNIQLYLNPGFLSKLEE